MPCRDDRRNQMIYQTEELIRSFLTKGLRKKYYDKKKIQISIYPQRERYLFLVDAYEDYCWQTIKKGEEPPNFSCWLISMAATGADSLGENK